MNNRRTLCQMSCMSPRAWTLSVDSDFLYIMVVIFSIWWLPCLIKVSIQLQAILMFLHPPFHNSKVSVWIINNIDHLSLVNPAAEQYPQRPLSTETLHTNVK